MILITSAAYITPALASELGKLPPCMLPVQNRRLYEHQITIVPNGERIIMSLPQSYTLTAYDQKRLSILNVTIVKVPDSLSLGQSLVYVLNVLGRYRESVSVLHGDTLFSRLTDKMDVCAISKAEDDYDWATANEYDKSVYAGFFSFSDQSLLIQKIAENGYSFIRGIKAYNEIKHLDNIILPNWMDFGLSNSYYRSISKLTTQRVFNAMNVTRYSVRKSSKDKRKIAAESNWIESLPAQMKHYAPTVWDRGEEGDMGYYEIEYYFLPTLANLFVFGQNKSYVWEGIIDACVEYLNDEARFRPEDLELKALQNDMLYSAKTVKRLDDYARQSGVSLDTPWKVNGVTTPSLVDIIADIEHYISKQDTRFVAIMHGDLCFSNILYDFKSKTIKVIDPRGLDIDGNMSVYGDFRYDVAKLAHSIIGMYDFIIGGMFEYKEFAPYDISLKFEISDELLHIQSYFCNKKFGGYTIEELNTYPILIHLFFSMLPLHNDSPERQKAMLANALRLYVEFKKPKHKMTIVIPMAGLSSRFTNAGYTLPKYMLYIKDKTLFNLAVSSFRKYFETCRFVFVARDIYDTPHFIENECKLLGIKNFHVVVTEPTRGQAETVFKGVGGANVPADESILIFNVDTFRPGFLLPDDLDSWDGYLECFVGDGANWSYAKTEDGTSNTKVIATAEKKAISNFCSTGIYYFRHASDFVTAYQENEQTPINGVKELYVAPLYNFLIRDGKNVHVDIIRKEDVCFCGIPEEYEDYLKKHV